MPEVMTEERVAARVRPLSAARVGAVFSAGALVTALLFLAARALAPVEGPLALGASVVSGAFAIGLVGSLAEWVVHGQLMHGRTRLPILRLAYELHHRAHHWRHYRPDGYLKDAVTYVSVVPPRPEHASLERGAAVSAILGQALFYAGFAIPPVASAWLLTGNVPFAVTFIAGSAAIVTLAIHLHDAVHCPGHSVLERFRWFWWLDRHHYVHHVDTRANVNFLLPLGDLLLGTLRRDLSRAERRRWPSYERARDVVHPAVAQPREPSNGAPVS